jgi:hypothetical protein
MADIKLASVVAPELKESDYGKNINDQFVNIDNNFKLIANRDFVKGDSGESLYIENVKIIKDGEGIGGDLYNALNSAIGNIFNSAGALKSVNGCNWDDAITQVSEGDEEEEDKKSGIHVPIIASKDKTTDKVEYICAASPVMLFDNRFNEKAVRNVDFSEYEGVVDVTSILNFKKDGDNWVCELNLSYPRLQYKDGSFSWVINNVNTIVKSTGIKGDPGESANIWIVQIPDLPETYEGNPINISTYFVNGAWTSDTPKNIKVGDLAIVYCENKGYHGFFVSQIKIVEDNNTVLYDPTTNIQNINYVKNTTEFFKSLGKGEAARGMFLKFDPENENSKYAHMFYNAGDNGENLHIKPTNDYSSLENYNGKSSINITGYNTTKISSKKINISASEDIEIIKTEEQQGSIKLTSGYQISMTSKEGMDLMDDTQILIKSNNIKINGTTELNNNLNVDKNVNIKNNISFLSGSNGDKHQIIVNGSSITGTDSNGNSINTTAGTTGSELTIWASNIHLAGNKDNSSNIITLGNGGMNESSSSVVNINGDLTVSGATELKNGLNVSNGNLYVSGSATVESGLNVSGAGLTLQNNIPGSRYNATMIMSGRDLKIGGDGNVIIGPGLKVYGTSGSSTLDILTVGGLNGVTIENPGSPVKFNVKCSAVFENNLEVTGETKLESLTISSVNADYISADYINTPNISADKISTKNLCINNMWISLDEISELGKNSTNWEYLGYDTTNSKHVYTPKHIVFGVHGGVKPYNIDKLPYSDNDILVVFTDHIFPPGHMVVVYGGMPDITNFHIWPVCRNSSKNNSIVSIGDCQLIYISHKLPILQQYNESKESSTHKEYNIRVISEYVSLG